MTTHTDDRLSPQDMPVPNGVDWATGDTLPPVAPQALARIDDDPPEVRKRVRVGSELVSSEVEDANDLAQAGWGVLFGTRVGDDIKAQLAPLLEWRARDARPFKVFDGPNGFRKGDTARDWLQRQGAGLSTVDPAIGVPFYLLIVAAPDDIPFEFQYLLDAYWAVGRLHFDAVDAYRRYATRVVAYESAPSVPTSKAVGIFAPRNDGDRATAFLFDQVARPLVEGKGHLGPLGQKQGFTLRPAIGEEASKQALRALLRGNGRPALLFTGSHGAYADAQVAHRLERIGALVTQDWDGPGSPLSESNCYAAADVAADGLDLDGLVHFFFACYSAGCPQFDSYTRDADGNKRRLLDHTIVSRLPQRMLERGALAVLGHMDRAFAYSFQNDRLSPQIQDMRDVLVALLKGWRVGRATDQFNLRWTVLSAELADILRDRQNGVSSLSDAALANRWVARDDARNYVLLGDPAVRLRVEAMA